MSSCPAGQQVCWSCGACVNSWKLVCGTCSHLLPLDKSVNCFALLGLPQRFDIEDAALEARFKRLQQAVHPDLFGSRSAQEQAYSAQASADVNVAYQTLRSPVSRAQYLLQLHGRDAIGETVGSGASDPALLMRVMEARELLEDAHAASEAVQGLLADVDGEAASALARLSEAFAAYDLDLAARLTVELQYLTKLALEAREWLAVRAEKEGSSSNGSP